MRNIRFEQRSSGGFLRVGHSKIPVALGKNDLGREVWGWVLPGGVFVADREMAMRAAELLNNEIRARSTTASQQAV